MTADDEIALGLQSAPQMAAQMGGEVPATDPRAREVEHIGESAGRPVGCEKQPVSVSVPSAERHADDQRVRPSRRAGVHHAWGLYEKLSDEAELAGVLGHEIGHVVERHVAQQIEKSRLGQSIVLGTGIAASGRRDGLATWALADLVDQMVQLKFSREDESQADKRGLQFMTETGYDPRAMIDVMQILQEISAGGGQPEFMQTHPDPGNRIEAIQNLDERSSVRGVAAYARGCVAE